MSWVRATVVVLLWVVSLGAAPARAQGFDPLQELEDAAKEELTEDEQAIQERLEKLARKSGARRARVVVLKWPDTDVGHENLILQALVRNAIGRADARFFPEIDLYQEGRTARAPNGVPLPPRQQVGRVPDAVLSEVRVATRNAAAKLSGRSSGDEAVAGSLLEYVDRVWFDDRPETREVLYDLYLTIGQAAVGIPAQTPPFYQMIGNNHNNYYLYLAAAMLWEEREAGVPEDEGLAARKPGGQVGRWLDGLVQYIDNGRHPPLPLAFHDAGFFDAQKFAREFKVVINGLERVVDDTGVVLVPRGRIDVSLERNNGFGLSEHLEVVRLDEKVYFVNEVARQKMGYDLLSQLMVNPAECNPYLRPDTLASLATYAVLHPKDEVFVAIPRGGSARDVFVWRWDPATQQLNALVDRNRGFPVRFALLATVGTSFGGGSVKTDAVEQLVSVSPEDAASGPPAPPGADALKELISLEPSSVPIDFQLRAHFNRLMLGFGMAFGKNIAPDADGVWRDRYQVDGNLVISLADDDPGEAGGEALKERQWSRLIYGAIGVFLLKDAPYGIGPRGYLRVGWYNLPHVVDLTGHIGFTEDPSFGKKEYKGRVAPILDLDFYAGVLVPFGDTVLCKEASRGSCSRPSIAPNLGLSLGAGFTF